MIKIEGHTFNPIWLSPDSIVIDIGGNTGEFSQELLNRYGCFVTCYEPDRTAYTRLKIMEHDRFKVVGAAVASISGRRTFYSAQPLNGGNSLIPGCREMGRYGQDETYEVDVVSFEQVLAPYEKVDLVKMDCEGAEFEIIFGTPPTILRKIKQWTIEFHDFAFKQFTIDDVNECIQWLESLGFKSQYDHKDPDKDYYFWRFDSGNYGTG